MGTNRKKRNNKASLMGLFLILCGISIFAFMRAEQSGVITQEWRHLLFSWPMALLLASLFTLAKQHYTWGSIMALIATFYLLPRLAPLLPNTLPSEIGSQSYYMLIWPLILIIIGISLLFKQKSDCCRSFIKDKKSNDGEEGREKRGESFLDKNILFGSFEKIYLEEQFGGGNIHIVFGDAYLDLRKAFMPDSPCTLEINVIFGNLKMMLPEGWKTEIKENTIMGELKDRSPKSRQDDTSAPLLFINTHIVFGGCEII